MQIPQRYRINTSSFAHYWQQGIGLSLLEKLNQKPDVRNADQYIPHLFQYDDTGDKLVQALHMDQGFKQGQRIINDYLQQPQEVDVKYRSAIDRFFGQIEITPSWLDWDLVKKVST